MGSHHLTNQTIHLDGDVAASESYYSGFMLERHDDGEQRTIQMVGRYLDRLERRDGEWRISERVVVPEMVRYLPSDATGPHWHDDERPDPDPSYRAASEASDVAASGVRIRVRSAEPAAVAAAVGRSVRGDARVHRVDRDPRLRARVARRAPWHRRRLSPVAADGGRRRRGPHQVHAHRDRRRARPALSPGAPRRGHGRPRLHLERSGRARARHRVHPSRGQGLRLRAEAPRRDGGRDPPDRAPALDGRDGHLRR